jgi:hypothetical protein
MRYTRAADLDRRLNWEYSAQFLCRVESFPRTRVQVLLGLALALPRSHWIRARGEERVSKQKLADRAESSFCGRWLAIPQLVCLICSRAVLEGTTRLFDIRFVSLLPKHEAHIG